MEFLNYVVGYVLPVCGQTENEITHEAELVIARTMKPGGIDQQFYTCIRVAQVSFVHSIQD